MTKDDLKPVFVGGAVVKDERNHVMGWGRRQADLIAQGFEKSELKKLVKDGALSVIQSRVKSGPIVTVYVYSDPDEMERLRALNEKIVAREKKESSG